MAGSSAKLRVVLVACALGNSGLLTDVRTSTKISRRREQTFLTSRSRELTNDCQRIETVVISCALVACSRLRAATALRPRVQRYGDSAAYPRHPLIKALF